MLIKRQERHLTNVHCPY